MTPDTLNREAALQETNEDPLDAASLEQPAVEQDLVTLVAEVESPRLTVLLVEDEELIAEVIGEAIGELGYAVHCVSDAQAALAHFDAGTPVDVLFTDINLPGNMNGVALAEYARSVDPGLPVVFASGRWGLLEELRAWSRSRILQKPYSAERAGKAVEALIAERDRSVLDDTGCSENTPANAAALAG